MKIYPFLLALSLIITGCTYTITFVHTQGEASDVVDETSSNTPSANVPINMTPNL